MRSRALAPVLVLVSGCVVGDAVEEVDEDNDPELYYNEGDDSGFDDWPLDARIENYDSLVIGAAVPAWPAMPPAASSISLGSAGFEDPVLARNGLEVAKGSSYSKAKVLYSVPVPDYAGEGLLVRGGFMVSKCGAGDIAGNGDVDGPCDKYMPAVSSYAPEIGARLFLTNSPTSVTGTPISGWVEEKCTENKHHCGVDIAALWGGGSGSYINLVVGAKANGASSWNQKDLVELESDCRSTYAQCPISDQLSAWQHGSKGRLDVTRFGSARGADPQPIAWSEAQAAQTTIVIPPNKATTSGYLPIFAAQVDGLQAGDYVDVDALLVGHTVGGQPQDRSFVGTTVQLVATAPQLNVPYKFGAGTDLPITAKNGRNCRRDDQCAIRKTGTTVVPAGSSPTMYVVVLAMAKVVGGSTNDKWRLDNAKLDVWVRRP